MLSGLARAQANSADGPVQIARMYRRAKGSAAKARTKAIKQLKAVLVSADPNLREELAGLNNAELFRSCARLAEDSKNDRTMKRRGCRPPAPPCVCWPGESCSSRTWKADWPDVRKATPRSCSP